MTSYVVDANVAAKWFLPAGELLIDEALHLRNGFAEGRIRLSVPDLFWTELGNIVWKAVRGGRMSPEAATKAIRTLSELNIPTFSTQPLLAHAFSIAATFGRTVYDSMYVALAVVSQQSLVTADERLANSLAAHLPVRWLGSIP